MAVWSILAAPLIMSADLSTMKPEFKEILLNKDVITVNQDVLGKQGLRVWTSDDKKQVCNRYIYIFIVSLVIWLFLTNLSANCLVVN